MSYVYKCASYSRLSREDDRIDESSSIITQKQIINSFAKFNNFNIVEEYTDDGYSGGNFDRPGFKKMIMDIEAGKINCVITKDLSRLGREIYKTGEYIEEYFLERGVRYIAINDGFDSNIGDAMLGIRLGVNDLYLRDVSRKVSSAMKIKQEKGDYIGSFACFGYKKDTFNKNHIIPDEKSKEIVKEIFNMYDKGYTLCEIADYLSNKKIPIPLIYRNTTSNAKKISDNNGYGFWKHQTIVYILTNPIYIGNMRQHVNKKLSYRSKKLVKVPKSEQIVVPNTHEAIIDKELFDRVQSLIPKNVGRNEKRENHLLDGLLYCGECNHRISVSPRRKIDNRCYTVCNYYRTYLKQKVCTMHSNNYDIVEDKILELLKEYCLKYMDKKSILNRVINTNNDKQNNLKYIKNLEKEISNINDNLDSIYIDRLNKNISEEQFNRVKIKLETELNIKLDKIKELKKEKTQNNNIDREKYIREVLELNNISRDIIINLIDRIEIFEDKKINLILKFNI